MRREELELDVDGARRTVRVRPDTPLLWALRDGLDRVATKYGCGRGLCGACTVHVDGRAVRSCLLPVTEAVGRRIVTLEGLAADPAHPLIRAWMDARVFQCGYCQPGQILSAAALLAETAHPDERTVRRWMAGNLCRCGTYPRIRRAVEIAATRGREAEAVSPTTAVESLAPGIALAASLRGAEGASRGAPVHLDRRRFLVLAAGAGASLVIGSALGGGHDVRPAEPVSGDPWAWLRIDEDGATVIALPRCEMGQGIATALAMIVVDELDGDWSRARTEAAPLDDVYGPQLTGSSDAVRTFWRPLRTIGAAARTLLVDAAAERWKVDPASCSTDRGFVVHAASRRRVEYGELARAAATRPLPEEVRLRGPAELRLVGRDVTPLGDAVGRVRYGADVRRPGMLSAAIRRTPVRRGRLLPFDASPATAIDGVHHVVPIRSSPRGEVDAVAVVADSFWVAERALDALDLRFEPTRARVGTRTAMQALRRSLDRPGRAIVSRGEADREIAASSRTLRASYEAPFLAHATMEPMSCAAEVVDGRCELWVGTQSPRWARTVAARVAAIDEESVTIHALPPGGSFGRRQRADFVADAVKVAIAAGAPVRLLWSREEDMRHGSYRPASLHRIEAALDSRGRPVAWAHRIAGFGGEASLVQGVDDVPYAIPHHHVDLVSHSDGPVRTGPWRGLARSQNAFVTESFLDEIAREGGLDPLALRLELLARAPLHRAVLERVARRAGWGSTPSPGTHRGIALSDTHGSICAQVAEISIGGDATAKVSRVFCVVDCGRAIHPDGVTAQIEGGILYGLSAALHEEITVEEGRVVAGNFDAYPILRMDEAPDVEVEIVESDRHPAGAGEVGVPAIGPAVANALFAATGRRVRRLPLRAELVAAGEPG